MVEIMSSHSETIRSSNEFALSLSLSRCETQQIMAKKAYYPRIKVMKVERMGKTCVLTSTLV